MRLDVQLPPIFSDNSLCVLDAYAFREGGSGPIVRRINNVQTQLSPVKRRSLHVQLDGEAHNFVETGGAQGVGYGARTATYLSRPIEPARVITIRQIRTKQELTLLWIDERSGNTIAVIGSKIHWDLDGIDVRFATVDRKELRQ